MSDAVTDDQLNQNEINIQENLPTEEELAKQAKILQGTFVGYFFPILKSERLRFTIMAMTFFMIAFVYTFLRMYKDNVIHSVLEPAAQNWLKLFTFVASLLLVGIIQKLLVYFDIDKVFEIATMFFGISLFFMAFLIKYRDNFQLKQGWTEEFFNSHTADVRGIGVLYVLTLIFNHWILSLFYILCEVISSIMVSYLFLTYANSHCTNDQNKRFVRIFYIFSNISGFVASQSYSYWNKSMKNKPIAEREAFYVYFTFAAVGVFAIVFVLKRLLDRIFLSKIVISTSTVKKTTKSKKSVSMTDGIYYAFVSKLLLAMSIMTLFYNISANLLTSIFTNSLAAAAKYLVVEKQTFASNYKAMEMSWTAALVVVVMLSPFSKLFEWFGVGSSGSIPVLISFFGSSLVCYLACKNYPALGEDNMKIASMFNDSERNVLLEVRANVVVSAAVKISKYAFFDIIKEAISMKINPEIRPLFKGVYDGVCGKLGKCSGAVYGIVMEAITGSRDARFFAPVTYIILTVFCVIWAYSVYYLHNSYKQAAEKGTYMSPDYIEGFKLKDE